MDLGAGEAGFGVGVRCGFGCGFGCKCVTPKTIKYCSNCEVQRTYVLPSSALAWFASLRWMGSDGPA